MVSIPRHKCSNEGCRKLHRLLPDFLAPYKHYEEAVICDSIDDRIKPEKSDYHPSDKTVSHWKFWLWLNTDDINGYMKSIAFRELGYSEELLKSGVSLLDKLRSSIPDGWLKTIIRTIYNSGASLRPYYT